MIEASFEYGSNSSAAMNGAYQYDMGQRLRMRGLPSPEELTEADELLSGETVAVMAHFAYQGDEQTKMRLAQWNDERGEWLVSVPDEYLTRHEVVNVYVYVSYGADESGRRNKTMYTAAFIPQRRPAPGDVASEEQLDRWDGIAAEVDLELADARMAIDRALDVADSIVQTMETAQGIVQPVQEAAKQAKEAHERLEAVCTRFDGMKVQTVSLAPGAKATADLAGDLLKFGVPKGERGDAGPAGEDGPSDMVFSFDDETGTLTIQRGEDMAENAFESLVL